MLLQETGIYFHIPFCIQKCTYCDFLKFARSDFKLKDLELYHQLMIKETNSHLQKYCSAKTKISSIYFGGGTPSIFPSELTGQLIENISSQTELSDSIEITLEADPKTISLKKLKKLRQYGINRLSIGAQSFDNSLLKTIGRYHQQKDIFSCCDMAREAGFTNISLDLIYGLPKQTISSWKNDLLQLITINPEHVSLYCLNLARGTKMFRHRKKYNFPEDDLQINFYNTARRKLSKACFLPYEISNFSKPGFQSIHNTDCWDRRNYFGIGLGASSFFHEKRLKNTGNFTKYQDKIENNSNAWTSIQKLSENDARQEFMFLQLRKTKGFSRSRYFHLFASQPEDDFPDLFKEEFKKFITNGKRIYLKKRGLHVSNEIFEMLF